MNIPYGVQLGLRRLGGDEKGPPLLAAIGGQERGEEERAKVWAALCRAAGEVECEGGGGCGGGGQSKRIKRLRAEQVRALEASFAEEAKLEPERKVELAEQLGLQPRQVAIWFQNRRARSKSKQLEMDFASLSAHYHSLLAETHRLKTQVAHLTSELDNAKEGITAKEGAMPLKRPYPEDALKDDEDSAEKASKTHVIAHQQDTFITTASSHYHNLSSPSCSNNYSGSDNSTSENHKNGSAYESSSINNISEEDLEYSYQLPRTDWISDDDSLAAPHEGLAILAYNFMQSHDLVVELDHSFTNDIHHVGMNWPW
ncbi:hypothetical protein L7F22_046959 [Adiantum nelumboides]|nr:hypothetical protein [Adiantum nelumboides]